MFLLHSPCLSSNGVQHSLGISTLICNTLLLVGRQWRLNHCPSSPPGFQLCSSLSFHKRLFLLQKLFCKYFYLPILQTATFLSFPVSPNACLGQPDLPPFSWQFCKIHFCTPPFEGFVASFFPQDYNFDQDDLLCLVRPQNHIWP